MSHSNLQGRKVVITRPAEDADRLAGRLRALGAQTVVVPAIEIEFTDPPELSDELARVGEFDWVVFTSRNGVEAAFRLTDTISGPRIAAIGPATAGSLRDRDIEPDLIPPAYVAEAILEAIGDVRGMTILLPRADIARQALADGLRKKGATVVEVAAYRTRPIATPRPNIDDADAVTFTSSSTVHGFVAGGAVPTHAKIVCIGPITAATAREQGLVVCKTALEYTEEGLIEALERAFDA